jgi:hypothetical protein
MIVGSGSLAGVGSQTLGLLPGTSAAVYQSSLAGLSLAQLKTIYQSQVPLLRQLFNRPGLEGLPSAQRALADILAGGRIPPGLTREALIAYGEVARRSLDSNGVQAVRIKIITEALKRIP